MLPIELTGIDRVRRAMEREELDGEIVTPGVPMPTVPLAASAIGCHESQIIKTVVFTAPGDLAVVAIANGTRRINKATLAEAAGVPKVKLASPEFVLERTGYPAGGVSPIGIRDTNAIVIIDSAVLTRVSGLWRSRNRRRSAAIEHRRSAENHLGARRIHHRLAGYRVCT